MQTASALCAELIAHALDLQLVGDIGNENRGGTATIANLPRPYSLMAGRTCVRTVKERNKRWLRPAAITGDVATSPAIRSAAA